MLLQGNAPAKPLVQGISPPTTAPPTGPVSCTMPLALPESVPLVAWNWAVPTPAATTLPLASTGSTAGLLELQLTWAPGMLRWLRSLTAAPRVTLPPRTVSVACAGEMTSEAGTCCTRTSAKAFTPPDEATTVSVPLPIAVTTPLVLTRMTPACLNDQVTGAPLSGWPCSSLTVALSWALRPRASKSTVPGVIATEPVPPWVIGVGSPFDPPQAARMATTATRPDEWLENIPAPIDAG